MMLFSLSNSYDTCRDNYYFLFIKNCTLSFVLLVCTEITTMLPLFSGSCVSILGNQRIFRDNDRFLKLISLN